jgi:hypothetical protein
MLRVEPPGPTVVAEPAGPAAPSAGETFAEGQAPLPPPRRPALPAVLDRLAIALAILAVASLIAAVVHLVRPEEKPSATPAPALEGNHQRPVRITNIKAESKCREPLAGTFYAPPQGASDVVKIGYDLDQPNPAAQYAKPSENGEDLPQRLEGDYFEDKKYELNRESRPPSGLPPEPTNTTANMCSN